MVIEFDRTTVLSCEFEKAYGPMLVTEFGIVNIINLVPENASLPILITESGICTDSSLVFAKTPSLITVTELGITTDVSWVSANAYLPILVTEFGIVTDVSISAPENASWSMILTLPSITSAPLHLVPDVNTPCGIRTEYLLDAPQGKETVSAKAEGVIAKVIAKVSKIRNIRRFIPSGYSL